MNDELIYSIALTRIPGIGPITARSLLSFCGDARAVFESTPSSLLKIPGIGKQAIRAIRSFTAFDEIKGEIEWYNKRGIRILSIQEREFPYRLKHTPDGPLILFTEGKCDLNSARMIAVIGTRKPSAYGTKMVEDLVSGMAGMNCVVVSGMAYGIDIQAHRCAVRNDIPTIGVLAHGLDRIYPSMHAEVAREIIRSGGAMISEFPRGTDPDAMNFPKRNRVVSGMCDGVIVIESSTKGGSMITADLAVQYDREVLAVPGRITDSRSHGCNVLIKTQKAQLIESIDDILEALNWDLGDQPTESQIKIPEDLTKDEKFVLEFLGENSRHIEEIHAHCGSIRNVPQVLLELELRGLACCHPGKMYSKA